MVPTAQDVERVARKLWGEPNKALSNRNELRFGNRGSKKLDLRKLTFHDFETGDKGGYVKLFTMADEPLPRSVADVFNGATYDYRDERGVVLFQVVRRPGHKFLQRRPTPGKPGEWTWSTKGIRRVLYRLPELLAADPDATVFIPEGEKDVDNVRALGLTATCNPGGAGKWEPEFVQHLRGRDLVILPDNDQPGRDHAEMIVLALAGAARSIRVLDLPDLPPKGDVSDWIAAGGTADALRSLVRETATEVAKSANGKAKPAPIAEPATPRVDSQDAQTDAPAEVIDLTILRVMRRPPPKLDLAVFGSEWLTWINGAAEAACCPADYIAAPLLAAASALIGNARWAQAWPGWAEPPHLWMASVGDSGDGKTPGANTLFARIVPELDRRMIGDFPQRHAEWKAAVEIAAARDAERQGKIKAALKRGAPVPEQSTDVGPGDEPQEPRLVMHDATIEKVASLLASAAAKGLLMVRDELSGFLLGMNAYNDAARAFWLEAWNGSEYRVDRVKNVKPLRVLHNVVSWFGTVQPERLEQVMSDADDGLLARFCWCWPDPIPFRRPRSVPDKEFALRALDRLRQLEMQITSDGTLAPIFVPLEEAARPSLEAFANDIYRKRDLAAGLFRSSLGKARGIALRAALALEMLWWAARDGYDPPPTAISGAALEASMYWVRDYALPMAERTFGDAACSPEDRVITTLARWIAQERPSEVHVRRMQREVRLPGLKDAPAIHAACSGLVDAGWLIAGPRPGGNDRNRAAYPVNPALWGALT